MYVRVLRIENNASKMHLRVIWKKIAEETSSQQGFVASLEGKSYMGGNWGPTCKNW